MATKKFGSLRLVAGDLVLTNATETAFLTISFPTSGTASLNLASGIENDSSVTGATVKDALNTVHAEAIANISSLTGDVTTVGSGAAAATISAGAIDNSKVSATAAIAYSKLDLAGSITDTDLAGGISISNLAPLTVSRALVTDGSGTISTSTVTSTEVSYLAGVTSSLQTQLDSKVSSSEKGAALGVATLDAGGKVPISQLPSSIMEFKGTWNASTNTPTLVNGTGDQGDVYRTSVAGTQDFGAGPITFKVGDWVTYSGTIWEQSGGSDDVTSVNGQLGDVVLDKSDIGLDQVDNTSDVDKPVSTATQDALNTKEDTITILDLGRGGTGVSVASSDDLLNALLPDQSSAAGKFLTSNGAVTSWGVVTQPVATYTATWSTADGPTKVITHNMGTRSVQVTILDTTFHQIWVDDVYMTDVNTVTLNSSVAPDNLWKVILVGVL